VSLVPCKLCGELFTPSESQIRQRRLWCKACDAAKRTTWVSSSRPRKRAWNYKTIGARRKARYSSEPNFRLRMLARSAARAAIREGRLIRKPCETCGATDVEAHHDDYSKALDVRWLCRRHHREFHGQRLNSTQSLST